MADPPELGATSPRQSNTTAGNETTDTLPNLIPVTVCATCEQVASLACCACRGAGYCSAECQKEDWAVHKLLCLGFSGHRRHPACLSVRAIRFQAEDELPQWYWLPYQEIVNTRYDGLDQIVTLFPYSTASLRYSLKRSAVLYEDRPHEIIIHFRNQSNSNDSIKAATDGLASYDWYGSAVAYGKIPRIGDQPTVLFDLDMSDYTRIVKWLTSFNPEVNAYDPSWRGGEMNVKGVVVKNAWNPASGLAVTEGPLAIYNSAAIPPDHAMFRTDRFQYSPISTLLGINLAVSRYPLIRSHTKTRKKSKDAGCSTMYLLLQCNPDNAEEWGFPPAVWSDNIGDLYLVRSDRKALLWQHVDALISFCQFTIAPLFERSRQKASVGGICKENVLAELTPELFKTFFERYRAEKAEEDPAWGEIASPYDV
ncbi:hypothetical protein BU16DRAFT_190535 [Lophium mytilinum]|uniref:MYND-type domain-containing protein n=1 Tax=Lophium mytilinum TaxID=390894 RepID=A0A6A6R9E0_9PEZI|nr:hypothetical protein BU16DRAFT_190535 [Lophium mytilinum]